MPFTLCSGEFLQKAIRLLPLRGPLYMQVQAIQPQLHVLKVHHEHISQSVVKIHHFSYQCSVYVTTTTTTKYRNEGKIKEKRKNETG